MIDKHKSTAKATFWYRLRNKSGSGSRINRDYGKSQIGGRISSPFGKFGRQRQIADVTERIKYTDLCVWDQNCNTGKPSEVRSASIFHRPPGAFRRPACITTARRTFYGGFVTDSSKL